MGTLKQFMSTQAIWLQQGPDGNSIKDYWTFDVSCLHRMYRADGMSKVAYIPMDVSVGDACPADIRGHILPFGAKNQIEESHQFNYDTGSRTYSCPKSGYWFRAMLLDENRIPYNQNLVGGNQILATNTKKFAFVAWPDEYEVSGVRTYIVNEAGTVYGWDSGSDEDKIVLKWPSPEEFQGAQPKWEPAD